MFTISNELACYVEAVIQNCDEFDHLAGDDVKFGCLMYAGEAIVIKGREVMAYILIPDAQGKNKQIYPWTLELVFGFEVDLLLVVDVQHWELFDDVRKIALVYHELCHVEQRETKSGALSYTEDGKPVLQLVDHNIGEFYAVVAKFGAWEPGLEHFREVVNREVHFDPSPIVATVKELMGVVVTDVEKT